MYTSHKQELIKGVYADIFGKVSVYLLHKIGVILTFFGKNNKYCIQDTFHFWRVAGGAHLSAHSHLVRTSFGLNYLPPASVPSAHPQTSRLFLFFEGPKGRMGPAKRGPIWAGQGTQPINAHPFGVCIWVPLWGTHYRSRLFFFSFVARPPFGLPALMGALKGTHMCTLRVHII